MTYRPVYIRHCDEVPLLNVYNILLLPQYVCSVKSHPGESILSACNLLTLPCVSLVVKDPVS